MKKIFPILLLFILTFSASAQSDQLNSAASFGVKEIYLAKDEAGKASKPVESFLTADVPIHCVVELDSVKIVTVKMNFVAEKVAGVKAETKVISVSYKTDGKQNQVNFTGKPDGRWIAGNYRIDIFIDETAAASKRFEIKPTANAPEKRPLENIKNFVPAKPKPLRRARKH